MLSRDEAVATARQKRLLRARAATLLTDLNVTDTVTDVEPLSWSTLLALPDWCFWSDSKRKRLILVAGALFISPAMRLWIDADRLRQVSQILGGEVFDAIMDRESVPKDILRIPAEDDPHRLLVSAGESVLLSSLDPVLQPRLSVLLAGNVGLMPATIAMTLVEEALEVLREDGQSADTAETGDSTE